MAQYRLKRNAGPHKEGGRLYNPGEVVESDQNLALLFREKFEVVEGKQPVFVGGAGGRTGNELPSDHSGRTNWDDDRKADEEAKTDAANRGDDGSDSNEQLASDQWEEEDSDSDSSDETAPKKARKAKTSKK